MLSLLPLLRLRRRRARPCCPPPCAPRLAPFPSSAPALLPAPFSPPPLRPPPPCIPPSTPTTPHLGVPCHSLVQLVVLDLGGGGSLDLHCIHGAAVHKPDDLWVRRGRLGGGWVHVGGVGVQRARKGGGA